MTITTTARGFSVLRFLDAEREPCSIQDSSLAEEACIWLGRDGPDNEVRMHLTRDMARTLLARLLHDADGDVEFLDRYGSSCIVAATRDGNPLLEAGVVLDFQGRGQKPMRLSHVEVSMLVPIVSTFVETGSISG